MIDNSKTKFKNKIGLIIKTSENKATSEEIKYMQAKFICKLIEWNSKK